MDAGAESEPDGSSDAGVEIDPESDGDAGADASAGNDAGVSTEPLPAEGLPCAEPLAVTCAAPESRALLCVAGRWHAAAPEACPELPCGDGVVQEGEECDDGNLRPGDGCTSYCTVERLALATGHSCLLQRDGNVRCWGNNQFGQLGIGLGAQPSLGDAPGEMGAALPPVDWGAPARVIALSAGNRHTCAVLEGGELKCWGEGSSGQLGQNNLDDVARPADVPPIVLGGGRRAVAVGTGSRHTCALLDDGAVKCWGYTLEGRLGVPAPNKPFPENVFVGDDPGELLEQPAVPFGEGRTAVSIAVGADHSCALLDDASVWCWGVDDLGHLGEAPVPADLGPGALAVGLWAGNFSTCARLDSGVVRCWGENTFGQLGAGDAFSRGPSTGDLPDLDLGSGGAVLALAMGGSFHCALLESRAVKCWGLAPRLGLGLAEASQSLGDQSGEMGGSLPEVDLGSGRRVSFVAARAQHACASFDDGSVKCWGTDQFGRLGLGNSPEYRALAGNTAGDAPGEMGDALPTVDLGP